jgi:hypothetical protein
MPLFISLRVTSCGELPFWELYQEGLSGQKPPWIVESCHTGPCSTDELFMFTISLQKSKASFPATRRSFGNGAFGQIWLCR